MNFKKLFVCTISLFLIQLLLSKSELVFPISDKIISVEFKQSNGDVEQIFSNYIHDYIKMNPEVAHNFGKPERSITYFSLATYESTLQYYVFLKHYQKELQKVDLNRLNQEQMINYEILLNRITLDLEGEKYHQNTYLFSHISNYVDILFNRFSLYQIETETDAKAYLSCMKQVPVLIDQYLEYAKFIENKDIYCPKYSVNRLKNIVHQVNTLESNQFPVYLQFCQKIQSTKISQNIQKKLSAEALTITETEIKNALSKYEAYLDQYVLKCKDNAGICQFSDGKEMYAYLLRLHSGTNYSPEEVHQLGLKEVSRIKGEMIQLIHSLKISISEDFKDCMQDYKDHVSNNPDLYLPKSKVIDKYNEIIKETEKRLPELFFDLPRSRVEVQEAQISAGASNYYSRPVRDGSKNGIFFTKAYPSHYTAGMRTLCYHETIPGHHLQIALGIESAKNRDCNSLSGETGFIEGWALYAERLCRENNFFKSDYERIENLDEELFRAMRLVVDTGLHYKGWTREEASKYIQSIWDWNGYSEIDRYSVWPAQACSYKLGELKILELREKYQQRMGDQYDIRMFHRLVLENGSMPLNLLEKKILNQ